MPAAILGPIAGAAVGGLMGGGDKGGGSSQTTNEPWAPLQKPLINSANTGQDLERYYQRNPFNRLQQQGYQNLFTDLDSFRNQIAPGMMQFANQMMQSDYQRGPRNSQREAMGGGMGGGMQTNMKQPMMMNQGSDGVYDTKPMGMGGGGLMGAMGQAGQMQRGDMSGQSFGAGMPGGSASYGGQQGLLAAMGQGGPFPMPSGGSYGLLDFTELNPFTSTTNGIPAPPAPAPGEADAERRRREEEAARQAFLDEERRGAGA